MFPFSLVQRHRERARLDFRRKVLCPLAGASPQPMKPASDFLALGARCMLALCHSSSFVQSLAPALFTCKTVASSRRCSTEGGPEARKSICVRVVAAGRPGRRRRSDSTGTRKSNSRDQLFNVAIKTSFLAVQIETSRCCCRKRASERRTATEIRGNSTHY